MEIILWLLAVGIGIVFIFRVDRFVSGRWRLLWVVLSIIWLLIVLGLIVAGLQLQEGKLDLVWVAGLTLVPPLLLYLAGLAVGWIWRRVRSSKLRTSLVCSTDAKAKLWGVILLSIPTIAGTGYFLTGVILWKLSPPIDFDPWRKLTPTEHVFMVVEVTAYFAAYVGAAFGPFLLPFAGYEAFSLTRAAGVHSRVAIWAWTFVVLGLVAAAFFWGWLSKQNIFI